MTVHELREQLARIEDEWNLGNSPVTITNGDTIWITDISHIGVDDGNTVLLEFEMPKKYRDFFRALNSAFVPRTPNTEIALSKPVCKSIGDYD